MQLPPPVHGVTAINEHIARRLLPGRLQHRIVNLNSSDSMASMHGSRFKKVFRSLKMITTMLWLLHSFRPQLVYFTIAPFGVGLIRDLLLTSLIRASGRRIVFHLHGTGFSQKTSRLYRLAYQYLFRRDHFIILSDLLYDDIARYLPRSRCRVLPNATEGLLSYEDRRRIYNNGSSAVPEIIYLANFDPRKGLLTAIDTFVDLRRRGVLARLRLVGSYSYYWGQDQMLGYLAMIDADIRQDIIVHGPAYDEEKARLLSNADIFFYPSSHDALPLVVLEAMAHGLPVVTSTQGALSDVVLHADCGYLFHAHDGQNFLEVLIELCQDRQKRQQLGRNAWQRYRRQYSFAAFDAGLLRIVSEYS